MISSNPLPLIGIPSCVRDVGIHPYRVVGEKYINAVAHACQALPVLIPAFGRGRDLESLVDHVDLDDLIERLDGLFLTGSPSNVEPHHYHGPASRPGTDHDAQREPNGRAHQDPVPLARRLRRLAAAAARQLNTAFVPIRKKGKLPHKTIEENFSLEYGEDTVAIHEDALKPGARVLLLDDLLATGGTAAAAAKLVRKVGAEIVEIGFLIELSFLNGREKLNGHPIHSVITY